MLHAEVAPCGSRIDISGLTKHQGDNFPEPLRQPSLCAGDSARHSCLDPLGRHAMDACLSVQWKSAACQGLWTFQDICCPWLIAAASDAPSSATQQPLPELPGASHRRSAHSTGAHLQPRVHPEGLLSGCAQATGGLQLHAPRAIGSPLLPRHPCSAIQPRQVALLAGAFPWLVSEDSQQP